MVSLKLSAMWVGFAALVCASTLQAQPAQDSGMCRTTCEADKQQCRSGQSKADPSGVATTAGVIALALTLPQARTTPNTPMGNPRDEVDARQRADQESKLAQRERDGQCNSAYMQCLGACGP
jgi:hypothetical protein